jgi:hypothetical protein
MAIIHENGAGGPVPYRLVEGIVALSVADSWHDAKLEWELAYAYLQDDPPGTCLCGHFPIVERCLIRNHRNGHEVTVGNVCVTRFMGINSASLFRCFRRVMADVSKPLSGDAVVYAFERYWINVWEKRFCLDTASKRWLSERQLATRVAINERVLARLRASRGGRSHA